MTFTPVKLVKGGHNRTARSAEEETNLRYNGWRSAPTGEKAAPAPKAKPESK
jgi:hypothetical protein